MLLSFTSNPLSCLTVAAAAAAFNVQGVITPSPDTQTPSNTLEMHSHRRPSLSLQTLSLVSLLLLLLLLLQLVYRGRLLLPQIHRRHQMPMRCTVAGAPPSHFKPSLLPHWKGFNCCCCG